MVLDLDLGRDAGGRYVNGADLVEGLRDRGWIVLVVSGSVDEPGTAAAIAAGAVGAVPKSRSFGVLLETAVDAAAGRPVLSESEHQDWVARHRRFQTRERELSRRLSRLSHREREVLELLAAGTRATAITEHFVVSMPTVRTQDPVDPHQARGRLAARSRCAPASERRRGPPSPPPLTSHIRGLVGLFGAGSAG